MITRRSWDQEYKKEPWVPNPNRTYTEEQKRLAQLGHEENEQIRWQDWEWHREKSGTFVKGSSRPRQIYLHMKLNRCC